MSERVYAWLLRLYPPHFRQAYGEAAMQLFRDRSRHERGFFPVLQLWLDLLADLAISVPRQHRRPEPALASVPALGHADETPSFRILEARPPRLAALVLGGILTMLGATVPFGQIASQPPLAHLSDTRPALKNDSHSPPKFAQLTPAPPQPLGRQLRDLAPTAEVDLDPKERQRVIRSVIANLKEHYVVLAVARRMAAALLTHERAGDYSGVKDGAMFAGFLTKSLREVSNDLHLEVVYIRNTLPQTSTGPSPERMAAYRRAMQEYNCTFEPAQILPDNIGYLKLNSFPDPSICEATAQAAMSSLNRADAIIFDLRQNRGGYPSMVMLIASYLFDHPEYMYNPREMTEQCWTKSPVPGNRLADKPVFVLTSSRTFSGAEHFSYDLKMLKRATLVGEKTAGATDVGVFHRIDDHFGIGIREAKTINPYSEPDWAVNGVQPDIRVSAADALATAEKLAETRLRIK
jgi:Peptidase family S41/N-terminal domain of Peptidase_S41 in eukaryotic IRBP